MIIDSSVTLIAPIRNVATTLSSGIIHLRGLLAAVFRDVKIILVESDSTDTTLSVAQHLVDTEHVSLLTSLGNLAVSHPLRTDRIAIARNEGLYIARTNYKPDFYIFADLDGINESLTFEGLMSCFRYSGWAGMVANQYQRYYDIWALRHRIWCPGDCWADFNVLKALFGESTARWIAVGSRQIHIPATTTPIIIESGFGGFGIYRAESILASQWTGISDRGSEVCEWQSFNRSLKGLLAINPLMRNTGPEEHYVHPQFEIYNF